jgi:hypothetical protein
MVEQTMHLPPHKIEQLLGAARIVDLGIPPNRFQEMVPLQERLRKIGYINLTDEDAELVADIWERLKKYVHEQGVGYEHLISLVESEGR